MVKLAMDAIAGSMSITSLSPSGKEIMNHKRGKRKNARAGCLLCKPNKMNGWNKDKLGHTGFGKLKKVLLAKKVLRDGA